jgi:DUF1680 family protein
MHISSIANSHTRWHTLPMGSVSVSGGFWHHKQEVNRRVSLRHGHRMLNQSGNLNNLKLAIGSGKGEYRTPVFMDSDIYKWLEAVSYDLANVRDPELERLADEAIDLLAAAQLEDGYLNSYYQVNKPDERWTDLDHDHELYCAGHLFEAAVAQHRATGKTSLLDIARRFADHIDARFGPGKQQGAPGHPEIELALVEMYRETGERRYLDLASFFVDQRGSGTMLGYRMGPGYQQDHAPVREADEAVGHAVRQLYLTAGVTDIYMETGEQALLDAMTRMWRDVTGSKMHITAGYGARFVGESFGQSYELPSDRCYCETCAAIAGMMWNWRLLLATGKARYADLLERSLYNGFLSSVSLDGQRYFYVNPLQSRGANALFSRGVVERPEWFGCACCPPNVMRQIAMVGHYAATVDGAGVQIHQYLPAQIRAELGAGRGVALSFETDYPWEGRVKVTVESTDGKTWALALRVPAWCEEASLNVNGQAVERGATGGTYAVIERTWQSGDVVELELPMLPRLIEPNPRVDAIRASLAIERGPFVYCLEGIDQEPGVDLLDVRIAPDAAMKAVQRKDLLGGVVVVEAQGAAADVSPWQDQLYRPAPAGALPQREVTLTAVPYYAWANRGPGTMRVWIPRC